MSESAAFDDGRAPAGSEPDPAVERSKRIAADVACIRCRYSLRSLETTAACPECGTPASDTLNYGLAGADLAWLRTLRRAVTVFVWTPVVLAGLALLGVIGQGALFGLARDPSALPVCRIAVATEAYRLDPRRRRARATRQGTSVRASVGTSGTTTKS